MIEITSVFLLTAGIFALGIYILSPRYQSTIKTVTLITAAIFLGQALGIINIFGIEGLLSQNATITNITIRDNLTTQETHIKQMSTKNSPSSSTTQERTVQFLISIAILIGAAVGYLIYKKKKHAETVAHFIRTKNTQKKAKVLNTRKK